MMRRTYNYVGPNRIAWRVKGLPAGTRIASAGDMLPWLRQRTRNPESTGEIIVTFIVDEEGFLRIAERQSEHVACAGGKPVLSAGEMAFSLTKGKISVSRVTNQSTGYCPEPESWPAVQKALENAGFRVPTGFDPALQFRRCESCGTVNIIKDGVFECSVCQEPLPAEWNLDQATYRESRERA
jgi:hypothetical protein